MYRAHPRATFFAPVLISIINVLFYRDFLPAPAPPLLLLTLPLEMDHDLFQSNQKKGGGAEAGARNAGEPEVKNSSG